MCRKSFFGSSFEHRQTKNPREIRTAFSAFEHDLICNLAFENMSEKEKIENFSKPKLLKLVDILRQYKPEHIQTPGHHKKSKIALQQQNAASGNKILSLFYKNQNYTATHFMIFAPVVIMLTRQKILSSLKYCDNMFHRCSRFTPSSACPTFARSLHKLR